MDREVLVAITKSKLDFAHRRRILRRILRWSLKRVLVKIIGVNYAVGLFPHFVER